MTIRSERIGRVLVAHLDDGRANALSPEAIASLSEVLDAAEHDPEVAAVVLHGRPGRFCAGFDLSVVRSGDPARITALMCDGGELIRRIYGLRVPVVAACTGHALAAGALLLLASDLRIGADVSCKIGMNEVAIGVPLPTWAADLVGDRLSRRHLQRALVLAEVTGPDGALEMGFLDEVVAEEQLLETALARAEALTSLDVQARATAVSGLRGGVLERMARGISNDRLAAN